MAKNSYQYTAFALSHLKDLVAKKVGFDIRTMRDCTELSKQLEYKGNRISPHTIGRFFQVIKNKNMPSQFTLDQLADFVGYERWDKFFKSTSESYKQTTDHRSTMPAVNFDSELSLIQFCLQDKAYSPLINYLKANRAIIEGDDFTKLLSILNVFSRAIENNTDARQRLYELLMSEVPWAIAYFRNLIHADAINSHYGMAVDRYFFKLIHPSSKEYKSQTVWGNAIMALHAFYNGQKKKFLQYSFELRRLSPPEQNTLSSHTYGDDVQVWIFARYHFVNLIYLFRSEQLTHKTLEDQMRFFSDEMRNASPYVVRVFLSYLFEALWVVKSEALILSFTDLYIYALNDSVKTFEYGGEELKALMAMILFYNKAAMQNNLEVDIPVIRVKISEMEVLRSKSIIDSYTHTYELYKNQLFALLSSDKQKFAEYVSRAKQHAIKMKNKYFINQIKRLEDDE